MEQGWIKLHRKLLDDPIWLNSTSSQKVVLITLMLMANHAERKWEYNGRPFTCKPGQMITSLESIKNKCGDNISFQNIRTALKRFETLGFLTNKSTKHNRLITIVNWSTYQCSDFADNKPSNSQLTNDQQTANSRLTTNNNDKNVKNEKKCSSSSKFLSFREMEKQRIRENNEKVMQEFLDAYGE